MEPAASEIPAVKESNLHLLDLDRARPLALQEIRRLGAPRGGCKRTDRVVQPSPELRHENDHNGRKVYRIFQLPSGTLHRSMMYLKGSPTVLMRMSCCNLRHGKPL